MHPYSRERAQLDVSVARLDKYVGRAAAIMPWMAVEQFEYERRRHHSAKLQLLATVDRELGVPADSRLVVEKDTFRHAYAPSASRIAPPRVNARVIDSPSALLWQVEFTVSLEVVEYPEALFSMVAGDRAPIALPAPHLLFADASRARLRGARVRQHLVALAAGLAVATSSGSAVGVASAATLKHPAPHKTSMIKAVTLGTPKSTQPTPGATPRAHRGVNGRRISSTAGAHTTTLVTTNTVPGPTPPPPAICHPKTVAASGHNHVSPLGDNPLLQSAVPALAGESENCQPTGPTHPNASGHNGHRHHKRHRHHPHHAQHHHSSHPNASGNHHNGTHHRVSGGAAVPPTTTPTPPAVAPVVPGNVTTSATSGGSGGFNLDPAALAALSQASSQLATDSQPPAFLIPIYKAAAARYHVPWEILAAINWVETDYGANLNISSAGAMGWMQFMPGTWQQYGVAADGSGQPNPFNPQDAIFAAARYLAANGAAQNLPKAIYAYNHATWYVVEVMQRAQIISDHAPAGAGSPLAGGLNLDPVTIAVLSHNSSPLASGKNQPAAFLIPIYQAAATRYHVPWQILAAINWMDTNHRSKQNTPSASAMRWMQFTPESWRQYGVAADGYSRPNPHSLPDAIFSAAHYLAANGAAHNLPEAIYAYNQGTWYTVDVMRRAKIISDHARASADTALAGTGLAGLVGIGQTGPVGVGQTGLPGAVKMLLAAYSAVGGPYSQANHDSFGQTAADLRSLGTDCSGFVSWVLDQVYPSFGNQTTVTLPAQPGVQFGTGHYVTMWDRPLPGNEGHVIINILGTWFESGGNTTYNPAGGIAPMAEAQAVGELTGGGFLPFHLQGL